MRPKLRTIAIVAIGFPFTAMSGGAEPVGTGFTYQGQLKKQGIPVNVRASVAGGGITLGPGSVCSSKPGALRACLMPQSGTCVDTEFPDCCVALLGSLGPPGTTCAELTGACYDDSVGACFDGVLPSECGPPGTCGGCRYGGDGSTCVTLDPPYGATCSSDLPGNCQSDNGGFLYRNDRLYGRGFRIADDFIMHDSRLAQLCWFQAFLDPVSGADCGVPPPVQWDIRFYEDAGGLPGDVLHEIINPTISAMERIDAGPVWRITTTFQPSLFGFNPGQRYWLEISGEDLNGSCAIHWASSNDGNGYSLWEFDGQLTSWSIEDRNPYLQDFAFCLDSGLSVPAPQAGSCLTCADTCENGVRFESCSGGRDPLTENPVGQKIGEWGLEDCIVRPAIDPTPGDQCTNPLPVTDGSHLYSTHCADTDGQIDMQGQCDFAGAQFFSDVWFEYEVPCSGRVAINLCGDDDYDGILAVYQNPDGTCPSAAQCPPGTELLAPGGCKDALCFAPSFSTEVTIGDCLLIRVGGEGTADVVGRGRLRIDCDGPTCLIPAPPTTTIYSKNRYLTIDASADSLIKAIRVTFDSLPVPYELWNGAELWVGPTSQVAEAGADVVPNGGPTFTAATLRCTQLFDDWSADGPIHVFHEGIVPGGNYRVDVIGEGCNTNDPSSFSAALAMTTPIWGDTVRDLADIPPGPPNGPPVDVVDALGVLGAFASAPGAIIKARGDLEPACVDLKINVTDVLSSLAGFSGLAYPFTPTAANPCNSTCTNVLP